MAISLCAVFGNSVTQRQTETHELLRTNGTLHMNHGIRPPSYSRRMANVGRYLHSMVSSTYEVDRVVNIVR